MGIRKEIKTVLREMDVRDPRQTIAAIERLVTAKITKPKKVPHLIVTQGSVEAKGVKLEDAQVLLKKALSSVERTKQFAGNTYNKERNPCDTCPDKAGCPDAN